MHECSTCRSEDALHESMSLGTQSVSASLGARDKGPEIDTFRVGRRKVSRSRVSENFTTRLRRARRSFRLRLGPLASPLGLVVRFVDIGAATGGNEINRTQRTNERRETDNNESKWTSATNEDTYDRSSHPFVSGTIYQSMYRYLYGRYISDASLGHR